MKGGYTVYTHSLICSNDRRRVQMVHANIPYEVKWGIVGAVTQFYQDSWEAIESSSNEKIFGKRNRMLSSIQYSQE